MAIDAAVVFGEPAAFLNEAVLSRGTGGGVVGPALGRNRLPVEMGGFPANLKTGRADGAAIGDSDGNSAAFDSNRFVAHGFVVDEDSSPGAIEGVVGRAEDEKKAGPFGFERGGEGRVRGFIGIEVKIRRGGDEADLVSGVSGVEHQAGLTIGRAGLRVGGDSGVLSSGAGRARQQHCDQGQCGSRRPRPDPAFCRLARHVQPGHRNRVRFDRLL